MDNETWLLDTAHDLLEREATEGEIARSPIEQLLYHLWFTDYCMRNAGDLANATETNPTFLTDARAAAETLDLAHALAAFSLPAMTLEQQYFERFDDLVSELRTARHKIQHWSSIAPRPNAPPSTFAEKMAELDYAPLRESAVPFDVAKTLSDLVNYPIPVDYLAFLSEFPVTALFGTLVVCRGIEPAPAAPDGLYPVDGFFAYDSVDDQNVIELRRQPRDAWDFGPEYLAIADDSGGNFLCLMLVGDNIGSVYYWEHDRGDDERSLFLLARSFSDLIDRLEPAPEVSPDDLKRRVARTVSLQQRRQRLGALILIAVFAAACAAAWYLRNPYIVAVALFTVGFALPIVNRLLAGEGGRASASTTPGAFVSMPWQNALILFLVTLIGGGWAAWTQNPVALLACLLAVMLGRRLLGRLRLWK